jgi:hypothetical protein
MVGKGIKIQIFSMEGWHKTSRYSLMKLALLKSDLYVVSATLGRCISLVLLLTFPCFLNFRI